MSAMIMVVVRMVKHAPGLSSSTSSSLCNYNSLLLSRLFHSRAKHTVSSFQRCEGNYLNGNQWRNIESFLRVAQKKTTAAAARATSSSTTAAVVGAAARSTTAGTAMTSTKSSSPIISYETLKCYYQLSKFRLSMLVTITAAAGFVVADSTTINKPLSAFVSSDYLRKMSSLVFGVMATSASANALNQVYEVARDAKMRRTMKRPLPSGRMSISHALAFAIVSAIGGTGVLYANNGTCAAALAAGNIVLYAGVYTPMKVVSISNTWIGAIVGAIPPLIGWVAAYGDGMDGKKFFLFYNNMKGNTVDVTQYTSRDEEVIRKGHQRRELLCGMDDPAAYILPALLYFWQLPHFMSLAWMVKDDYALGGYRMLPVIDASGRATAAVCLRNCLYLLPVGFFAVSFSLMSYPFAIVSTVLNVFMADAAMKFLRKSNTENARLLFRRSLYHLPIVMGAAVLCRLPSGSDVDLDGNLRERRAWGDWGDRRTKVGTQDENSAAMQSSAARSKEILFDIQAAPFPFLPPPSFQRPTSDYISNKRQ